MQRDTTKPSQQNTTTNIPDIDIIDLDSPKENSTNTEGANPIEAEVSTECTTPEHAGDIISEESPDSILPERAEPEADSKQKTRLMIHIGLIVAFALFIVIVIVRFFTWGDRIDLSEIFSDEEKQEIQNLDVWDNLVPLLDADGEVVPLKKSDGLNIVLFGNHPFSDDRDSEKSIASMLEEKLGGKVYNLSLSGSYLAAEQEVLNPSVYPRDALSLYWLALESTDWEVDGHLHKAIETLGDELPEGEAVYSQLTTLDFDTVDVIVIMYDATDYLLGHNLDVNEGYNALQVYAEVFDASLDVLQSQHPNTRIIVMSPPYAFSDQKDKDGNYISSDIYIYNEKPLSVYAITQYMKCYERSITFIDNIYGTFNEDNAKDYLLDNLHLNQEGRKKIVDRLVNAINYFGVE